MMRHAMTLVLTLTIGGVALAATTKSDEVTLSGCVVRGEDGFLLTNAAGEPSWHNADNQVVPGPVGTTGGLATIFYWLNDDADLKDHVGHRVEIKGELDGDLKEGEIELDRKNNWTEMTVKSDGRKMKARVPESAFRLAPAPGHSEKGDVLVRKVDVDEVRMLSAACDQ
jgi:hypothetical protein